MKDFKARPTETGREIPLALVVDDDSMFRLLAHEVLTEAGFNVEEAEDGIKAIDIFEKLQPDIVLLDVQLPGIDGFAVCEQMRNVPGKDLFPILMITGLGDNESIDRAYQAGATNFITKPVNWALLGHNVRYMLRASRIEAQLLRDAMHDSLTGLPNRSLLMDRLEVSWQRAVRHSDYFFAVLFVDLDRFKIINDSLGHGIGDELLIEVSARIKECSRTVDTVARLGGDEFVILLEDIGDVGDAEKTAERILEIVRGPIVISGNEMSVTCSIGIAVSSMDYMKSEDLLRDADTAMYRAKSNGKAQYAVFDHSMHAGAVTILRLESELRRALEHQEFCLHYQPIVSLLTGEIKSVEALIRWVHPVRGLVMPGEFVPLAEETGMIIPIGEWVLETACRQIKAWNDVGISDLRVAVNVSSRQLKQRGLVEMITRTLDKTSLKPGFLELEITESVIMEDSRDTIATLNRIKESGVRLTIDDFGIGYSSLSYLPRFPADTVKIDRSFVNKITISPKNFEIIKTVVSLCRSMGLTTTAEGVETIYQFEKLKCLGCSQGQGYLFSKPKGAEEIEPILWSACKVSTELSQQDRSEG
jgi:diguanylate cyclase (GGDEF)-like protein